MLNLLKMSENIDAYFSPKVVGEVNDVYVKIAKIKGQDVPWHQHENEDELFYILKGELLFEEENREAFVMKPGDMHIVKRTVQHRVSSEYECVIVLIENKSTLHLGDTESPIAKSIEQQLL